MSALPKNVRAQVERANALAKQYTESLTAPPSGEAAPEGAAPPAGAEPTATPPVAAEPTATPPTAAPAPVAQIPQEGWEQKYKVLQGKYNAEVPRLQKQTSEQGEAIRQLREQLTATQNLLASLGEQRAAAPVAQPTQATPPARPSLIKDEERREFGDDLIDVMRRVAREENAGLLPEIDRRVAPVARTVQQVVQATEQAGVRQAQSDRQTVLALLGSEVPNWLDLNADAGFLEWLDQKDPYAGAQRGELLKQAFEAHDGPRVVAFFKGYLKEHAVVTPPAAATPPTAPKAPQRKLEQLVAPGLPKTGAADTQDGSGKRVWTRAEIRDFYAATGNGSFKGTTEQRKAMERDIFAAQSEGRIR